MLVELSKQVWAALSLARLDSFTPLQHEGRNVWDVGDDVDRGLPKAANEEKRIPSPSWLFCTPNAK